VTSVLELLGPDGPLSRALPGYEERPGQLEMALAVERTMRQDRVLLCEAGTGTGKTLAYLVPAILSGKKVVVSTATRALQEQIFEKDLPLIARVLGLEPKAALMKGLSNYLCRRRFAEFGASAEAIRPMYSRGLSTLHGWVEETETGDLGELVSLSEQDPLRAAVASSSETRVGAQCQFYDSCFVTRMRREAEAARLVIVNHHLFLADLALRGAHPGRVLPDYDIVVFDEAHQLEDIATEFFGVRVTSGRVERSLGDAERTLRTAGALDPLFGGKRNASVDAARAAAEAFFATLAAHARDEAGRATLEADAFSGELERVYLELDAALDGVVASARAAAGRAMEGARKDAALADALDVVDRRAETLREQLATVVKGGAGRVTWVELGARGVSLSSSPVDLSIVLRERIFESVSGVVMTSATLATRASSPPGAPSEAEAKSPFGYVRSRLGLGDDHVQVDELVVGSPFDFERQALLYTPKDLPPPHSPDFLEQAVERVRALIEVTGGGCFVLTTSVRSMRSFHARLKAKLPRHGVLIQGEAPKAALLSRFRAAQDAVLVATMSFWEGVDVPGRALRLVVLEKIPFLVPSDPIVKARSQALEEAGKNPFMELSVPAAAITLKQGFGRLVRTRADAGIVALLDERVHRRGYGRALLESLPPARRSNELSDVKSFWRDVVGAAHTADHSDGS
jgi:ATP-dependent DNA helicase DinG